MKVNIAKKLLLTPFLLMVFIMPFYLLSADVSAAPRLADCENTDRPNKCEEEFKECHRRDNKCRQAALDNNTDRAGTSGEHQCGNLSNEGSNVKTKFDFGCLGKAGPDGMGPIQDLVYALIRFASIGVGIAVTVSLILAGLQYTIAEGNPENTQKAKQRAQYSVIALLIYIFTFAILQYLIPGGLFNPSSWIQYPLFIKGLGGFL